MRKGGRFVNLSCFVEGFATAFLLHLSTERTDRKNAPPSQVVRLGILGLQINEGFVRVSLFSLLSRVVLFLLQFF